MWDYLNTQICLHFETRSFKYIFYIYNLSTPNTEEKCIILVKFYLNFTSRHGEKKTVGLHWLYTLSLPTHKGTLLKAKQSSSSCSPFLCQQMHPAPCLVYTDHVSDTCLALYPLSYRHHPTPGYPEHPFWKVLHGWLITLGVSLTRVITWITCTHLVDLYQGFYPFITTQGTHPPLSTPTGGQYINHQESLTVIHRYIQRWSGRLLNSSESCVFWSTWYTKFFVLIFMILVAHGLLGEVVEYLVTCIKGPRGRS